jgi:type IV secretory pathway VirB4 component
MAQAMQSTIPLGMDKLKKSREFPTSTLAASFPFISSTPPIETDGILLGHDRNTLNPIVKDLSKLSNSHVMILAKSGAGKSFTAKLLITRMLMGGTKVFIVDPNGEYLRLCQHYGGQKITLSRESETVINPLDMLGEDYADKRLSLIGAFSIMCGGLTPRGEGIVDKTIRKAYANKGITEDKRTWAKEPPTISDVLELLEAESKKAQKSNDTAHRKEVESLIARIGRYAKGGVYGFVDRQTRIDANSEFVVFDINELPDEVKPLYMYIVLDFIVNRTKDDLERKAIVVDEGWSLLNNPKTAERLLWMIKASRKFNTGMIFITQEVNDLIGNKAGESILANTAVKVLLSQDSTVIDPLAEIIHLNSKERNLLTIARKGEGILIVENTVRVPIIIKASPQEHDLITTHPDELKMIMSREMAQPIEYQVGEEPANWGVPKPMGKFEVNERLEGNVDAN